MFLMSCMCTEKELRTGLKKGSLIKKVKLTVITAGFSLMTRKYGLNMLAALDLLTKTNISIVRITVHT